MISSCTEPGWGGTEVSAGRLAQGIITPPSGEAVLVITEELLRTLIIWEKTTIMERLITGAAGSTFLYYSVCACVSPRLCYLTGQIVIFSWAALISCYNMRCWLHLCTVWERERLCECVCVRERGKEKKREREWAYKRADKTTRWGWESEL